MTDSGTLHPAVAALAAAIVQRSDGVALADGAAEAASGALRGVDAEVAVRDLLALAAKVRRIAGDGGFPVVATIAGLVAEQLGSTEAASDRFAAAGVRDERLFAKAPLVAPRADAQPAPAAPVKARRGLKRD